jgi:hypothetical protein
MTHGLKIKKKPKQKCGPVASVDPKSPTASSTTMVWNLEQVASGGSGDKLIPRGLKFYDFHAMKHEEQTLGQKFSVDVDAWIHRRLQSRNAAVILLGGRSCEVKFHAG